VENGAAAGDGAAQFCDRRGDGRAESAEIGSAVALAQIVAARATIVIGEK